MFARISPKSSRGRWLRLMLVLFGEVPPGNCQYFIDQSANKKFVYLSNLEIVTHLCRLLRRLWVQTSPLPILVNHSLQLILLISVKLLDYPDSLWRLFPILAGAIDAGSSVGSGDSSRYSSHASVKRRQKTASFPPRPTHVSLTALDSFRLLES
jgi:hypothetical protein